MSLKNGLGMLGTAMCISLAACGGGGNDGVCRAIGGVATASATTGSTFGDASRAADGDLGSYATLQPSAVGLGGGSIRATAGQQGTGDFAGVLLSRSPSGRTTQITITTYLAGVQQDSNTAGTDLGGNTGTTCPGICVESGANQIFFGIQTSRSYDAIEATLQVSGGAASAVEIRELCKR